MAKNLKAAFGSMDVSEMTESDKELEIKRLERERDRINRDIEVILKELASKTKNKKLKPRKRKPGKSANDYNYKEIK